MPCDSSHMESSDIEMELSRVLCIHDELDGKTFDKSDWDGYHQNAYNKASRIRLDEETSRLCSRLQTADVGKLSLEAQIWWRDHQEADRKRVEREMAKARTEEERAEALSKLTPHERRLLGW